MKIIKNDPKNFHPNLYDNEHKDYKVKKLEIHPDFNNKVFKNGKSKFRTNDNIAVLVLEEAIDLQDNDGVNAACYPG